MNSKLVRDKIPEIITKNGEVPKYHKAEDKEYWMGLKNKLKEETDEFYQSEKVEEIADILEVLDAIKKFNRISDEEIIEIKENKIKERGKFDNKIILD